MKGSNFIPLDMFPSRAIKNVNLYKKTIKNALESNQNMLRVWGGGIYEYDIFYDLCDENGIMIFHDFMFANSIYPFDTKEIKENIKEEINDNVKRIGHHPSIVHWSGNNEIFSGKDYWMKILNYTSLEIK